MAEPNVLSPIVDIISRENGKEITSYSQSADRVVNLSQSSVVKINASPESVNFYERQGDDLIVHMKDGTTVRYQSFFTLDANGLHSELVFEDALGVHRASFPFATEAGPMAAEAVVPTIAETSVGALTGGAGIAGISTLGVLGGIAGAVAIGGIAIAASGSGGSSGGGGGGGDDGRNSGGGGGQSPEPVVTPKIVISTFTNDNQLNSAEVQLNQLLWGSSQNINAGQMVAIKLNGKTYFAQVGGDGMWRVEIPSVDLRALSNGPQTVTASYTDKNGNVVTTSETINIDTTQPAVAIAILSTDNHLNAAEAGQPMEVRGITSLYGSGVTLVVTFNGKNYIATLDSAGNWSTSIPAADLQLLKDGNYTVTARVSSGNLSAQATHELDVIIQDQPKPTLNTPLGDGFINSADMMTAQTLSGTTGVKGSWQTVTVTINNKTWTTTADANGKWTLTISAADMSAMAAGSWPVTVVAKDAAGNTGQVQGNVIVDLTPPSLSVLSLTGDNILSLQEAKAGQILSGTASIEDQGRTVSVTLNGKKYLALVGVDGKWQISLSPADLAALPQGNNALVATLTDAAGNTTRVNASFDVKTLQPGVTVTPLTGDDALNAAEVKTSQTLSGRRGAAAGHRLRVRRE